MFTDNELVIIEEALEYWHKRVATDLSSVELKSYDSALTKVQEALETS